MKIQNTTALVTGANRGIGKALVRSLLDAGAAKVYAGGRRLESLDEVVAFDPDRVVPVQIDVTDDASVKAAAAAAPDVSLLINNAGVMEFGGPLDDDDSNFERQNAVNVHGLMRVTRAFTPHLTGAPEAAIVNLLSIVSFAPMPGIGHYSTTKATAWSLTKSVRQALSDKGVSVHGVFPGPIDTDMAEDLPMEKASVSDTAKAIVAGVEAGDEEIYPDPMSKEIGPKHAQEPAAVDAMFASMG